jgi:hypothetical protein
MACPGAKNRRSSEQPVLHRNTCARCTIPSCQRQKVACTLFKAIRDQFDVNFEGADRIPINTKLLERWFLKTAINLSLVGGALPEWPDEYGPGTVPVKLVKTAFGRVPFLKPTGLYFYVDPTRIIDSADQVKFTTFSDEQDSKVLGCLYNFRGLDVLNIEPLLNLVENVALI